jgi:hypothetical protein
MTTIREAMTEHALSLFDAMVEERERETRSALRAAGCPRAEIEAHVADCHARLARERKLIPGNVTIELMKAGVQLREPAHVWH